MKRKPMNSLPLLLALALVSFQIKTYAMEKATESVTENTTEKATESVTENTTEKATDNPTEKATENAPENVTVPTENKEVISVVLPVVEDSDPFSFFIDPLHIFYNTFGSSGGDITVEEDTYLLFYNRDGGGYKLSSRSDSLRIINQSTVPIEVTITAKLENADGISVMQDREFGDRDSCDLYLALVDNEGNEWPLSENGEVSVTIKLDRAPLDAYAYTLCEDTGEYQCVCQLEEAAFDAYSFGLVGACNEKGDWAGISGKPHVTISWNVEPVISDGSEAGEEPDENLSGNLNENQNENSDESLNENPDANLNENPDKNLNENPDESQNEAPNKPTEDISGSPISGDNVPDKENQNTGGQTANGDENAGEDPDSTESAEVNTEGSEPGDDTSDGKGSTEDNGPDSENSGVDKEEESDNDISSGESSGNDNGVSDKQEQSQDKATADDDENAGEDPDSTESTEADTESL
ncbi:MAG: hypothetical protein HFH87_01020 [Lachnospiraceae bacterium]|nr:hypothetical protein [Lachnospiraceae bacterium]